MAEVIIWSAVAVVGVAVAWAAVVVEVAHRRRRAAVKAILDADRPSVQPAVGEEQPALAVIPHRDRGDGLPLGVGIYDPIQKILRERGQR